MRIPAPRFYILPFEERSMGNIWLPITRSRLSRERISFDFFIYDYAMLYLKSFL